MQIVIEKAARRLTLMDGESVLCACRVALGREPIGPKRMQGDGRTPEGQYTICLVKEQGKYGHDIQHIHHGAEDTEHDNLLVLGFAELGILLAEFF